MTQCPKCQSSNVVVTEEVYVRKGKGYYQFWQTILVLLTLGISVAVEQLAVGILIAIAVAITVSVFSLINANKKATSRTKLSCLACQQKTYL